jgi:hypothetical protein
VAIAQQLIAADRQYGCQEILVTMCPMDRQPRRMALNITKIDAVTMEWRLRAQGITGR